MAIKKGDTIQVDYEGRFEDGKVFDSSMHGDHSHPLEFTVGSGQVINGFDEAVIGMNKGEEKEITILPKDAYGEENPELKKEVPRNALPQDPSQELKPGMMLAIQAPDGRQFPVKIAAVSKETITIDLNHPLAGKKLIFKLKIAGINSKNSKNK